MKSKILVTKLFLYLLRLPVAALKFFIPLQDESSSTPRDQFYDAASRLRTGSRVLDVGTKQSREGFPTHSFHLFPGISRENYVMIDIADGLDVDQIEDLHVLPSEWGNRFDAVIAIAVFEHLERPWVAAQEVSRVLAPGGFCYIATHQTYPLHGYPSDYFRFSKEALTLILEDAGLSVLSVAYEHRALIIPPTSIQPFGLRKGWNRDQSSYLVVHLFARKLGTDPNC